jgi:glycerate kinase
MRVVVATDSWKDCLPAQRATAAMTAGVRRATADANVCEVPMADGGQGTVEALVHATGGHFEFASVSGPLGEPVQARFGVFGDGKTAVVEMAAAAGLELVPPNKRDATKTATRGVGELLLAAAKLGVRRIILGIGGSATNDGGAGLATALGYRLLDEHDLPIEPTGGGLAKLARIDASHRSTALDTIQLEVACDVTNRLVGPNGASHVFGPQKGADAGTVERLDRNLAHFAQLISRDLGREVADIAGAGAAGGLGAGLLAFTNARLVRGVELVIDAVRLESKLKGADLCLTGEGRLDGQSAFGKTAVGVAQLCKRLGVPCVALAGSIGSGVEAVHELGVTAYFGVAPRPASLEESLAHAESWIADSAEQAVRLFGVRSSG